MTESGSGKEPVFESAAEKFIGHYDEVRGYIRQQVIRARLLPFMEDDNLEVLDFGGGAALDSIWAANLGQRVDYWDNSTKMRREATQNMAHSKDNVRLLETDPIIDVSPRYDLVMSHVVMQYIEPKRLEIIMPRLAATIKPGGLLSIADRNWNAVTGSPTDRMRAFKNNLNLDCWVYRLN